MGEYTADVLRSRRDLSKSILPWSRRCVTATDRPIPVREYQKWAREQIRLTDECLRIELCAGQRVSCCEFDINKQNSCTEETGLLADIFLVLLCGDLAKSLVSAFLAEFRFRASPPCFFHGSRPLDSELHACAPTEPSWLWWFDVFYTSSISICYHGLGDVWQPRTDQYR